MIQGVYLQTGEHQGFLLFYTGNLVHNLYTFFFPFFTGKTPRKDYHQTGDHVFKVRWGSRLLEAKKKKNQGDEKNHL